MAKKILLADDSITIQKVVELTFSDGDYEVTAVNNGAKCIQKLSEMRPDIILSDIIMPEKNGYEVCEFVKSHPEYRTIPVILLTGTFEPFDPDRADKAGCDAVVTKPFESQSLIQKVDELIEQSRSNAPTAPGGTAASSPAPASNSPWSDETPTAKVASPFAAAPPPPPPPPPTADPFTHDSNIFGAAPSSPPPTTEMPFASSQSQASTMQIPVTPAPPAPAPPSQPSSPWDEQPPAYSGETKAFPKMSFDDMARMAAEKSPTPPPAPAPVDDSPFGAPPAAEMFSGETRAIPKMSLEELRKVAKETAPPPAPEPASSSWDQPVAFSGETKTFPRMSFDDLDRSAGSSPMPAESSMWDEKPAPSAPAWSPAPDAGASTPPPEPMASEKPSWAPPSAATSSSAPAGGNGVDLTEEQIDRIARRVVQLMSDQVVRNIAWEVIPDLAEMVVKERIRQLEAE